MSRFPSEAWCQAAIDALNDDPDLDGAARGWEGDFGVAIDLAAGGVRAVFLPAPAQGRFAPPEFLDLDELEDREPRYFARASEADWWALITGGLDPIAAIVQKRLVAKGDLSPVVARLQYRGLAERWLARLRAGE